MFQPDDEWIASSWNQRLAGFCESHLSTSYEFANTFTSLVIIFWGIYGLYQLPSSIHQTSDKMQFVFSLLICVGIGSTLFHWTLYVGWGLLDSLPMLLSEWMGLLQMIEIIFRVKLHNKCITKRTFCALGKSTSVICSLLVLLCVIYTALYGQHSFLFPILFTAVPALFFMIVIWCSLDPSLFKNEIKESAQYRLIFRHLWTGFAISASAAFIWNFTERLCDDIWYFKYIPFHGIFHMAIGYGMFNLIQAVVFIDFETSYKHAATSYKMVIRTQKDGTNTLQKWWYFAVPVLCHSDAITNDVELCSEIVKSGEICNGENTQPDVSKV